MNVHRLVAPVSGQVVRLRPADLLEVRLTQHSSGGYLWSVARTDPVLAEVEDRTLPGPMPGAAADRVFTFEATDPGSGQLVLVEARPWENESLHEIVLLVEVGQATGDDVEP